MTTSMFDHGGRTDDAATLAALEVDYTPTGLAVQIVDEVLRRLPPANPSRPLQVLCPAAGSGVFARAVRALRPDAVITCVEIRESEREGLLQAADHVLIEPFDPRLIGGSYDLVIDNPPFSWFAASMLLDIRGVGLLGPRGVLAFVGLTQWGQTGSSRETLARWWPALQLRITGRPAFRGDGKTDFREISVWCWRTRSVWEDQPEPGEWRTVQMPALPPGLLRWNGSAVPGTYPVDQALVERVRRCREAQGGGA